VGGASFEAAAVALLPIRSLYSVTVRDDVFLTVKNSCCCTAAAALLLLA
jgi:hypothetical protein